MSRYRHSLRVRILAYFVLSGAILGPVVATALIAVTYVIEERAAERAIAERLEAIVAAPGQYALRTPADAPNLHVLANVGTDQLPPGLAGRADGVGEYHAGGSAWTVAVDTANGRRYAVVEDMTILEDRERLGLIVAGVGTLMAMYVALWLGFYFSNRLLAPLTALAERVSGDAPLEAATPMAADFADDEVGDLAHALDRYRDRAAAALRRERAFSADASHELRNPLTVIQNAAELIADDPAASARSARAAARIEQAAARMRDTVEALLLMVRDPDTGGESEPVAVGDCVEAVLAGLDDGRTGGPSPTLERRAEPTLRVPASAVEIIVANLVRNARDHARARTVTVTLLADRLTVVDDGVGIPAGELASVLERGYRGRGAGGNGAGLGLAIVHRLCKRYGWRLLLDSTEGGGTRIIWVFGTATGRDTGEATVTVAR